MKLTYPRKTIPAILFATCSTRAFQATPNHSRNIFKRPFLLSSQLSVSTTATEDSMTAATADINPLLQQEGLPLFSKIEPNNVEPAIEELLDKLQNDFTSFESSTDSNTSKRTFDETLGEVERIQSKLDYAWGVAGHLNSVKNSDELRDAYNAAQPGVIKAMTQFSQSKPLYEALIKLDETCDKSSEDFVDMQMQRAIESSIHGMKLGGVGLEGEAKERFNEIKLRLGELSVKFGNNILDATKAFGLVLTEAKDVENVPESTKLMWAQSYVTFQTEKGEEATLDAENGPWRVTLDGPSYMAAMQHLPGRSNREEIYVSYITRASDFGPEELNNIPIVNEILSLKAESCKLLGYENYAQQSLSRKMAPSVESVEKLSDLILEKALPMARNELKEITELAKEQGGEEYASIEKLSPWDITYWSERLKEQKYSITQEQLRPYFAFDAVLQGLFDLCEKLFDIKVVEAAGEDAAELWHPDVRFFKVLDSNDEKHIASFYLDPYSRPAEKRGGAWMNVCIGKSDALKRDIPVAYLICNGSPPVKEKNIPSLMTFNEVTTLFHEFGHGLQHMLTRASVGDVAGINGVEWDAVELPSQFMENWCFDKSTVYGFAKHYETGEALPEELFEKIKQQKNFMAASMACRQLYFGQMDMELHAKYDPSSEDETIFDVQRRVASKYSPHNMPLEKDRFLCTFGHIFAGGYAAGYYSYKWAEVMSADAFGAFEDVGLDNEDEVKAVGKKFRDTVLSLGGGVHPTEVFKAFRGREPTPDALLRHEGFV